MNQLRTFIVGLAIVVTVFVPSVCHASFTLSNPLSHSEFVNTLRLNISSFTISSGEVTQFTLRDRDAQRTRGDTIGVDLFNVAAARSQLANILSPVKEQLITLYEKSRGYTSRLFTPEEVVSQNVPAPVMSTTPETVATPLSPPTLTPVQETTPSPTSTIREVIREIVSVPSDTLSSLDTRINDLGLKIENLKSEFTHVPTIIQLPPSNTKGVGSITMNPQKVDTETLSVSSSATLSSLTVDNNATISGNLTVSGATAFSSSASISASFELTSSSSRLGVNPGNTTNTMFEVGGTASISGALTLNNITYTFPATQTANKFLQTDGSGTLSWATAGVSSNSLDFDEIVDTMLLDADLTINRGGYKIGIGSSPSTVFEVQGTASASYLLTGNTIQVGGYSSAAYSRFGTATLTTNPAGNWITGSNDLLVSGDLYGVGSLSFKGPASMSNALYVGTGGKTGNVGIGTTAPGSKLEIAGQVKITGGSPGSNKVLTSDTDGLASWGTLTGDGMLSAVRVYTSTDTWSKPANLDSVVVWTVGGGGGSGGVVATGAGVVAISAAGGGGGASMERIASASLGATETVTIGAAGAAGAAGNNAGGTGGTSSFGAHLSATGGGGGDGGGAVENTQNRGAIGGEGSSGDLNLKGEGGNFGIASNTSGGVTTPGNGGNSILGGGGRGAAQAVGEAGGNYGGGGGGSSRAASQSPALTGAAGAAGVIIVYEYTRKAASATGSDLAEWVSAASDVKMQDIVSIDPNGDEKVVRSSKPYDPSVAGIISTEPGLLIGKDNPGNKPLALAGRVPVKVSIKNGEIKRGDAITTSDIPGVGMKSTRPGAIVGKAMQALTDQEAIMTCSDSDTPSDPKCGLIVVLVNVSWYDPRFAMLTIGDKEYQTGSLGIDDESSILLLNSLSSLESMVASLSFRIEDLEQQPLAGEFAAIGESLTLASILDAVRALLSDGTLTLVRAVNGIFTSLTTEDLAVHGQATLHNGVTTYDQLTGEPYCLQVRGGITVTLAGKCSDQVSATPSPTPPISSPESAGSSGGEPSPTPTAQESPPADDEPSPTQTPEALIEPTASPTPEPSASPTPEATPEPTPESSPTPTPPPTE